MRVPFRQGIVYAPANFLSLLGGSVSLVIPPNELVSINFADGLSNYLVSETESIPSAWTGPFVTGTDYWLYWDIDVQSGALTHGYTLYEPVEGPNAPASPQNKQCWYDTTTSTMFEWNSLANKWQRKVRVFAAHLMSGTILVSMSINSPSYMGTQVGDTSEVSAGNLVFDSNGIPLKKGNGTFFTTEDVAITGNNFNTQVKFESIVLSAKATANIPAYTMVRWVDFYQISPATNMLADPGIYGLIEVDANIGDIVNVVREGVVQNVNWNWSAVGINTPLYVTSSGQLTHIPQASQAVGITISPSAILLTATIVDEIAQIDAVVTINSPTEGILFSGATGPTSSSFNVTLQNDLAAVEGLTTTGIAFRDGNGVWHAGQANLTTDVSGILPAVNGGTGANDLVGYAYAPAVGAPFTASTTIPGSDIAGDITGNAANVTGVVAIANGGTGATTQAAAANAILPPQSAVTVDKALFSNGTNVEWRSTTVGTVTSVGLTTTAVGISVANTPVTTSGDLAISLTGNLQQVDQLATVGLVSRDNAGNIITHTLTSTANTLNVTNGDGALGGNINVDLPVVNIPNAYTRVVVDEFGRVTSGEVLLDWIHLANTPTTLLGYGITDAYTKVEIDALTWNWSSVTNTPSTILGYGITDAYTKTEVDALTWNWSSITNAPTTLLGYGITDGLVNGGGITSLTLDSTINKPASGTAGRVFIDTTLNTISYDDGAVWTNIGNDGTVTSIEVVSTSDGISVANGTVTTSGTVQLSVSNDLAGVEGLATYGFATRTADNTWSTRSILGAIGSIDVTNSDGTVGDVLIDLPNVVAAGTYNEVTVDAKGRVTGGTLTSAGTDWSTITNNPTTVAGYGITDAVDTSMVGSANGVASLDGTGKIPSTQLPAIAITDTFVVTDEPSMLALTAQTGDVAVRLDESKSYILRGATASILSNWQELLVGGGAGGSGVIYVNATSSSSNLTVTGGPIIDSGTLSFGLAGNLQKVAALSGAGFVKASAGAWSVASTISLGSDVTGTLSITNGGTGATSFSNGYIVSSGAAALSSTPVIPGTDISGDILGNAANVNGVVAIANGGTGATTAQDALNALLPAQIAGVFVSNGTTTSWSTAIPGSYINGAVADATNAANLGGSPASNYATTTDLTGRALIDGTNATGTWTINTTGNAANVTGVVAVANGGTGASTASDALNALLPAQTGQSGRVLSTDGVNATWIAQTGGAGGYSTVSYNGTPSPSQTTLNFTGSGFVISNGATSTDVAIPLALTDIVDGTWTGAPSITTVGVVNSGTWNGNVVDIAFGGTGASTAQDAITALLPAQAANTNGFVLTSDGTSAFWSPPVVITGISQASHGFVVGDWLAMSGSTFVKAQANSAANAEVVGVVNNVIDADTFVLQTTGYVFGLPAVVPGTTYYLSASTPGAITDIEPSTPGQVSKPVFIAHADLGAGGYAGWIVNSRGRVIENASAATATFVNADLTGGIYVFNHNLNDTAPFVAVYNDSGVMVNSGVTITSTSSTQITVDLNSVSLPITGTWTIKVRV